MGNAVVGKFCQRKRDRLKVALVSEFKAYKKQTNNPLFVDEKILEENLVLVYSREPVVVLDSHIAIAFTIYELSKLQMLTDFYEVFKPKFPHIRVLMSDTDSVAALVETNDLMSDFKSISNKMDFSNYPKSHPLYDDTKKKALKHWKDESGGDYDIDEFVTLRAKCYSYKSKPNMYASGADILKETKLCKGILRNCVKNDLTFAMYKEALFEQKTFKSRFYNIALKDNEVFTTQITKTSLNCLCTKRYWLNCGIHSVPYNSIETYMYEGECWRCEGFEPPQELKE